jgi:hypothetical protein
MVKKSITIDAKQILATWALVAQQIASFGEQS